MGRLIDADALALKVAIDAIEWSAINNAQLKDIFIEIGKEIDNQPTVDAEPVRHGEWKRGVVSTIAGIVEIWECSECEHKQGVFTDKTNYCPNCGARMN